MRTTGKTRGAAQCLRRLAHTRSAAAQCLRRLAHTRSAAAQCLRSLAHTRSAAAQCLRSLAYTRSAAACARRVALGALVAFVVPAAALLQPAALQAQQAPAAAPQAAGAALPGAATLGLLITGMQYIAGSQGHNEWVLHAASARLLPDGERAELEQVQARIGAAAPGGAPGGGLTLHCDRGFFDLAARDFRAEGNVRGETLDGRRIDTERLAFDASRQRVFSDAPVVIEDRSGRLEGTGFEYFVREDRFQLREARVLRERP